jgi:hypothetical protein
VAQKTQVLVLGGLQRGQPLYQTLGIAMQFTAE